MSGFDFGLENPAENLDLVTTSSQNVDGFGGAQAAAIATTSSSVALDFFGNPIPSSTVVCNVYGCFTVAATSTPSTTSSTSTQALFFGEATSSAQPSATTTTTSAPLLFGFAATTSTQTSSLAATETNSAGNTIASTSAVPVPADSSSPASRSTISASATLKSATATSARSSAHSTTSVLAAGQDGTQVRPGSSTAAARTGLSPGALAVAVAVPIVVVAALAAFLAFFFLRRRRARQTAAARTAHESGPNHAVGPAAGAAVAGASGGALMSEKSQRPYYDSALPFAAAAATPLKSGTRSPNVAELPSPSSSSSLPPYSQSPGNKVRTLSGATLMDGAPGSGPHEVPATADGPPGHVSELPGSAAAPLTVAAMGARSGRSRTEADDDAGSTVSDMSYQEAMVGVAQRASVIRMISSGERTPGAHSRIPSAGSGGMGRYL